MPTFSGDKLDSAYLKDRYSLQLQNGQWIFPTETDLANHFRESEKALRKLQPSKGAYQREWSAKEKIYLFKNPMEIKD